MLRRSERAEGLFDRAVEAEDFQAVGVQLRECLLSLLPAMRRRVTVADDIGQPKEGDFINWYNLLMDILCPGDSNKELRQYLKHTAKDTWQLVGWLVHDRDANKTAPVSLFTRVRRSSATLSKCSSATHETSRRRAPSANPAT